MQTDTADRMDYLPHPLTKKERAYRVIAFSPIGHFSYSFLDYIADNWHVYEQFEKIAFDLISRGYKKAGAKMIIEVIRWQRMTAETNSTFKINNSRAPDLSRLFHLLNPQHADFFNERQREHE